MTLRIEPGSVLGLLGSNGAGKTTTLNAVAGLVAPSAGTIDWDGASIARLPSHAIVSRGLALSPEGWRLVVDGHEGEAFEQIDRVVWGPYGHSVAYAARRDGAWHVVTDGRLGAPYAEVEEPVFAATVANWVSKGGNFRAL